MTDNYIYGRGGCSFVLPDYEVLFIEDSIVKISQEVVKTTLTNNRGRRITKIKGYRLSFSVSINNIREDDYTKIMTLLAYIQYATSSNNTTDKSLQFYPRTKSKASIYDIDALYRGFSVLAINNIIRPKRIASGHSQAGEVFTFNFTGRTLSSKIDIYKDVSFSILRDNEGDSIVDENNDSLIIIN